MTKEEAIMWLIKPTITSTEISVSKAKELEAYDMAIEALRTELVRCKDCRHANECHKSVQYTHNEQSTITIGYTPIEWCSRGERKGGDDK